MTSNNNRKRRTSASSSRSGSNHRSSSARTSNKKNTQKRKNEEYEFDYVRVLIYFGIFVLFAVMFLFSLGIFDGGVGLFITKFLKGLFGFSAYILPIVGILTTVYCIVKDTTKKTVFNVISAVLFVACVGMIAHLFAYSSISGLSFNESMKIFYHDGKGGGVIFGFLAYIIDKSCGRALVWILSIVLMIASIVVMFGKYIVRYSKILYARYHDLEDPDPEAEREYTEREIQRLREKEAARRKKISYKITEDPEEETPKGKNKIIDVAPSDIKPISEDILYADSEKVKHKDNKAESGDIHQIHAKNIKKDPNADEIRPINVYADDSQIKSRAVNNEISPINTVKETPVEETLPVVKMTPGAVSMIGNTKPAQVAISSYPTLDLYKEKKSNAPAKPYKFPPVTLLSKGSRSSKNKGDDIIETANKLKETLSTFGVEVSIDPANCSKGPAVTRYELTPAPGVKVSRIVSLSDDIKLSLGAADIRIEAPIPGKSAVGIEVPNSESSSVPFRDLIESADFHNSKSNLAFAVGKDLSGQVVISDIAKMPHLLIAGATGSGKSVCINTIIMSILYKAHPEDVKLILIDPKVVELSVYNGIPHLLLPVVTDPKQASASLHWGVSEMEDRYKKFADAGVRDLKGYNEKAAEDPDISKLPQVVIIVDELADLMMVAGKEVEESICRLAQLARAAGIHLIIATQRPSVDVITGLIKANMPSRIAFSVSSGIDSRTILDSNGAEKLLGKGDMLFFPQGMNKPSRVQGCFVSDNEVLDVVDFIKNQNIKGYDERIIESVKGGGMSTTVPAPGGDLDELFGQAGMFIIGKEKASIGALQRAFKIGFNRAARIMDQLEAKGVVGPEEGTKPRKILMDEAEFTAMVNSIE
ncbi:DNA segregation ATPase FtsK/SpoIIIE, S-DNA-T family [Lachnospiraceae bacterium G41]|nr:DNA segregation ATPase FtsK/SpoIIIE, S-DNA-T family [Lachnospiraceae bacterium G41]